MRGCYFIPEGFADGVWNLLMIAIDPRRHGKGLGTKLMRHVKKVHPKDGIRILLVDTSGKDEFQRTRGFYEMLGYEQEARIRVYWLKGDDQVAFHKLLTKLRNGAGCSLAPFFIRPILV